MCGVRDNRQQAHDTKIELTQNFGKRKVQMRTYFHLPDCNPLRCIEMQTLHFPWDTVHNYYSDMASGRMILTGFMTSMFIGVAVCGATW